MAEPEQTAPVTGIMQMLPMFIRQGMQIQGLGFSMLPWGAPGLSTATGLTADAPQAPLLLLAYEWPVPWVRTVSRMHKVDIEWLHLHRYSTDHRLATGVAPFAAVQRGGDPPDHQVATDRGPLGVDCTAFTVEERRAAQALFVNLRRRIAAVDPVVFGHLSGYMVYLWFPDAEGVGRPFKPNHEAAITELLEALRAYEPDPNRASVPGGALPQTAPDLGMATTAAGASFYAVPHFNATPDTLFASITGFELGLVYTTAHTNGSAWAELGRLVAKHDKEGVDWLLISAGAPNREGQIFPTEEVVAQFMIENPLPPPAPSHIKRVTLHLWSRGQAVELLGSPPTTLFGPVHGGTIPAHRPIFIDGPTVQI